MTQTVHSSDTHPSRQRVIIFSAVILLCVMAISVWFVSRQTQIADQRSRAAEDLTGASTAGSIIKMEKVDTRTFKVTFNYPQATTGDHINIYDKAQTNMLYPEQTRYLNCGKNPPTTPVKTISSCTFSTLTNGTYIARYFTRSNNKDVLKANSNEYVQSGALVTLSSAKTNTAGEIQVNFSNIPGKRVGKATDFVAIYEGLNSFPDDGTHYKAFKWLNNTATGTTGVAKNSGIVTFSGLSSSVYHVNYIDKVGSTYTTITTIPVWVTQSAAGSPTVGPTVSVAVTGTGTPTPTNPPSSPGRCDASCDTNDGCQSDFICATVIGGIKRCRKANCPTLSTCDCPAATATPIPTTPPQVIYVPQGPANLPQEPVETPAPTSPAMLVADLVPLSPTPGSGGLAVAPPELSINPFYDKDKKTGPLLSVSGTTDPGSQLSISILPDGVTSQVTADAFGDWQFASPNTLSRGEKQLTFIVQSPSGGRLTKTETFTVTGGSGFPILPVGVGIIVVLGGAGGYMYFKKRKKGNPPPTPPVDTPSTPEPIAPKTIETPPPMSAASS